MDGGSRGASTADTADEPLVSGDVSARDSASDPDDLPDENDPSDDSDDSDSPEDAFLRAAARAPAAAPPAQAAALLGRTVGRYRVLEVLGEGGMGVVYRAEDQTLGRDVALKVLPAHLVGDTERRERLLREARSAAAVSHAAIATVYDVGESGELVFIAMEHVRGQTLRAQIRDGGMPLPEVVRAAREIARGLAKAHEAGVIHRDLKPDNVMVGEDGQIKILDFGLAKLREPGLIETRESLENGDTQVRTAEGHVLGTPAYMSPEQAKGRPVDERTDLFSFGITLYEMATGKRPFEGSTAMEIVIAIDRDAPAPARSHRRAIPADLERIIDRCLRKAPDDRYPSARALAEDLARLEESMRAPPKRQARAWLLLAPALVAVAAVGAWLGWSGRAPGGPTQAASTDRSASALTASASAPTAPAPAPAPTPITSLPAPARCSPEALTEYRAGLQSFRDGGWEQAHTRFERAAAADPACAEAHLRLAQTSIAHSTLLLARKAYQRAVELRGQLGERDRMLLDALEPLFQEEPPNPPEWVARVRRMAERFPGDAEVLQLLALWSTDARDQRETAARAVANDPSYADAWQVLAMAEAQLGRDGEARAALDACVRAAPNSTDCIMERMLLNQHKGLCSVLEADARRWIAKSPDTTQGYYFLAGALAAEGRPREAIEEAMQLRWARIPGASRRWIELYDQAKLAALRGDFEAALRYGEELGRAVDADAERLPHTLHALAHADALLELDRAAEAGAIARAVLRRKDAWTSSSGGDATRMYLRPWEPWLLYVARRGGAMDLGAWRAARDGWVEREQKRGVLTATEIWTLGFALPVETGAEAAEALRMMPKDLLSRPSAQSFTRTRWTSQVFAGKALLLGGKPAEAIPFLRAVATGCSVLEDPFLHTWSSVWLGEALEATGDTPGACAAYRAVVERWGGDSDGAREASAAGARPRSVTAGRARERAKALGCGYG